MVGDVEYESIIWPNGIEAMTAAEIVACFDSDVEGAQELERLYHIVAGRLTACDVVALDLINDMRFALQVITLITSFRKTGKTVYGYVFDQASSWQASRRAHHAVELVMLFGRLDMSDNHAATIVRHDIRDKWVRFCDGQAPWSEKKTYAFGPHEHCGELTSNEHESRRRVRACTFLEKMGPGRYKAGFRKLAAGKNQSLELSRAVPSGVLCARAEFLNTQLKS